MLPTVSTPVFSLRWGGTHRDKAEACKASPQPRLCGTLDEFPYLPDTDLDQSPMCHKWCDLGPALWVSLGPSFPVSNVGTILTTCRVAVRSEEGEKWKWLAHSLAQERRYNHDQTHHCCVLTLCSKTPSRMSRF